MKTESEHANGVFTFQVSHSDIGQLFSDIIKVECADGSPLAGIVGKYRKGSRKKVSPELREIGKSDDAAKATAMAADPTFVMNNRTGGGAQPLSFFSACGDGSGSIVVVTPSFRGSYLFQLFEDQWHFLAWWLQLNSSWAEDSVPNYMPPPLSYESITYLLHAIDLYRHATLKSQLDYAPTDELTVPVESLMSTLQDGLSNRDMRWLVPTFVGLMPGLHSAEFEPRRDRLQVLAEYDFLFPVKPKGKGGKKTANALVFGEAGRMMGIEFYRSWFRSVGFETRVRRNESWTTAHCGFLAPTAIANHLVLRVSPEADVKHPAFNHQAMTRQVLERKMVQVLSEAISDELAGEVSDPGEKTAVKVVSIINCTSCGKSFDGAYRFCLHCGVEHQEEKKTPAAAKHAKVKPQAAPSAPPPKSSKPPIGADPSSGKPKAPKIMTKKFCTKCGGALKPDAQFCTKCGHNMQQ